MTEPSPRRLPVDLVMRRSFLFAWESRAILGGPLIIFTVLSTLADLALSAADAAPGSAWQYLVGGAQQVFALAFAVGLHRYVLQAEAPHGFRFFRFDRNFLHYALTLLAIILMVVVAAVPLWSVGAGADGPPGSGEAGLSGLVATATVILALLLSVRLAMTLPAAALGDGPKLREIWAATRNNGLRLLGVFFLTAFPFAVTEAGLIALLAKAGPAPGLPLTISVTILLEIVTSIQLVVINIMLSLCYDVLVRGGGPRTV